MAAVLDVRGGGDCVDHIWVDEGSGSHHLFCARCRDRRGIEEEGANKMKAKKQELTEYTFDDLKSALVIAPEAIEEEFVRVPRDILFHQIEYARLEADATSAYNERKRMQAEVYLDLKSKAASVGEKVSETALDAKVATDERVVKAYAAEVTARRLADSARGVVEALRAKANMVQSLGAHMRAQQDPTIRHRE